MMQRPLLATAKPPAVFDPTRTYRYSLYREWGDPGNKVVFVMLNPSTADEVRLDPTVTRCCGYARRWGYGAIEVVNIFAYRSTDPKGLLAVADPVGEENDQYILAAVEDAALVVAAWGVHGALQDRGRIVQELLADRCALTSLGVTKDGHPRHPLYLRADAVPVPF